MKTIFNFLFFLCCFTSLFAQNSLVITAGPSFQNVTTNGLQSSFRPDYRFHNGLQAQVLWSQAFSPRFSLITGVGYTEKGFQVKEGFDLDILNLPMEIGVEANTTLRYAELPVQMKYTFNDGPLSFYALAGPSIGYAMSGEVRTKANLIFDINLMRSKLDLSDDIYNRLELSGTLGLGGELKFDQGAMVFQVNYQQGFSRVIDNTLIDLRLKNYGFGMNIGYKIYL
jgi:hypothetical protein